MKLRLSLKSGIEIDILFDEKADIKKEKEKIINALIDKKTKFYRTKNGIIRLDSVDVIELVSEF